MRTNGSSLATNIVVRKTHDPTLPKHKKTTTYKRNKDENKKTLRNITTVGYLRDIPKGVDKENLQKYEKLLIWLIKPHERKSQTYEELAKEIGVSYRTLFNWLDLPETNAYVNEYIRKLYMKEKQELYEHHKKLAKKDRAWARWVAEYYEGFLGNAPSTAPVTVVFNFPAQAQANPEQAEMEIVQESGDDE